MGYYFEIFNLFSFSVPLFSSFHWSSQLSLFFASMRAYGWEESKSSLLVFLPLRAEVGGCGSKRHRNNILAKNPKEKKKISPRSERDFPGLERENMRRTESSQDMRQRKNMPWIFQHSFTQFLYTPCTLLTALNTYVMTLALVALTFQWQSTHTGLGSARCYSKCMACIYFPGPIKLDTVFPAHKWRNCNIEGLHNLLILQLVSIRGWILDPDKLASFLWAACLISRPGFGRVARHSSWEICLEQFHRDSHAVGG